MLLILRAPYWFFILLALTVIGLAELMISDQNKLNDEKAIAIHEPQPKPVDLSAFNKDEDVHLVGETHITGWVNSDHNKHLIKKKRGTTLSERYLFVFFGSGDTANTKIAKAAMVLTKAEREKFVDYANNPFDLDVGPNGITFRINGEATRATSLSSMAKDSMKEDGLTRSPNFVFIEPYFEGREAALTPKPADDAKTRETFYGIAGALALVALFKYLKGSGQRAQVRSYNQTINSIAQSAASPITSTRQEAKPGSAVRRPSPFASRISAETTQPARRPAKPGKTKRFPNWVIGLSVVVLLLGVLPYPFSALIMPLLILGGILFIAKKSLDGVGSLATGAATGLTNMARRDNASVKVDRKSSPFDRLS